MNASVRFLVDWTNSSGKTFAAGSTFTRRGKTPERARANVARWSSAWIREYRGQLVLVPMLSVLPIAVFVADEATQ